MTTLRVAGVPEHFNLPWHLAMESGAFRNAGIDLQWRTVPEGTGAMCDMLRNGEVDMAVLVTEGAVRDILNGNPSRIVATYVGSPLHWGVYVGVATDIQVPAELVGKPFAISRVNSGSHLVAMAYARSLGWLPGPEDFIVVENMQGAEERMRTTTPVAFLWEVATTSPWEEQGIFRKVDEFRPPWPCFMVVATEKAIHGHADVLQRALETIRAQAAAFATRPDAPELVAQRQVISLPAAQRWFKEVKWSTDGSIDADSLLSVATALRKMDLIEGSPTKEELMRRLTIQ
ncbi:MAG: ABC transporter substrate-binding protein [Flavobacteriales bacterium]